MLAACLAKRQRFPYACYWVPFTCKSQSVAYQENVAEPDPAMDACVGKCMVVSHPIPCTPLYMFPCNSEQGTVPLMFFHCACAVKLP
jgi:hypothetical protein